MDEHKSFPKRMKDIVNTYIKQEQSAHTAPSAENTEQTEADQQQTSNEQTALQQRIAELEEQLAALTREYNDVREKYVRSLAEMDNLRKRTEREKEQLVLYATERLFSRLVEILDDLNAAVEAGKQSRDYDAMLNGLEMIAAKAHRIYEEHGVRPLEVQQGEPFNVELHEALVHVPHPELPEGTIVQQIQRGYLFRDRVLRHARVVTSAGNATADGSTPNQQSSPSQDS